MRELDRVAAMCLQKATIFDMQFSLIASSFPYTRLYYLFVFKFPVCAEVLFLGKSTFILVLGGHFMPRLNRF